MDFLKTLQSMKSLVTWDCAETERLFFRGGSARWQQSSRWSQPCLFYTRARHPASSCPPTCKDPESSSATLGTTLHFSSADSGEKDKCIIKGAAAVYWTSRFPPPKLSHLGAPALTPDWTNPRCLSCEPRSGEHAEHTMGGACGCLATCPLGSCVSPVTD